MSHFVTFGEIMLRLTTPGHERLAQAESFEITHGGAEANVAVLLARLGVSAEFVTRLPANDLGDRAFDELRRHGVGTAHIARGGTRLGLYFLEQGAGVRAGQVIYDRAGSAIAEAAPGAFDWPAIFASARWFHWTGITPALSDTCTAHTYEACKTANAAGHTISFDVNYRAKLWEPARARTILQPLLPHVHICIAGADEARAILGAQGDSDEEVAADLAARHGFRAVAIPHRSGASASTVTYSAILHIEGKTHRSRPHETHIIDRIGAGDAFTAALIFALDAGFSPQSAIDFAAAAGALKHTIPGDFCLGSREEIQALAAGGTGGKVRR